MRCSQRRAVERSEGPAITIMAEAPTRKAERVQRILKVRRRLAVLRARGGWLRGRGYDRRDRAMEAHVKSAGRRLEHRRSPGVGRAGARAAGGAPFCRHLKLKRFGPVHLE